jgi:WD40 repeat protein
VSIESSAILPVRCDSGHCSPNSEMIGLTHGHDGLVALWDSQNNRMVKSTHLAPTSLSWVKGRSQRLLFHPDGKRIVGIARDSESIHLLDQTLQTIQVLSSNNRKLNCIAFSAQANRLIAGTDTGGLVIWNCEDSSSVRVQGISKEGIGWICVNDRHGEVIVAAVDGLVSQWQWREGSLRFVQSAQFDSLYGVVLSQRRDTLFVLETDIGIHGEITSLHALDCRTFARRELVTSR